DVVNKIIRKGYVKMNRLNRIKDNLQNKTLTLLDGTNLPVLGQGTWKMGEHPGKKAAEIKGLQTGLDLGMKVIDTAEMYGDGMSERLVGEAIKGRREDTFLVSKVYPHHANSGKMQTACEGSLKRLKTDYLDLYLLHWRGGNLRETEEELEKLKNSGKNIRWGESNCDTAEKKKISN